MTTETTATPTKETLLARVESLIDAGYTDVKTLIDDSLAGIEDFFGHKGNADATPAAPEAAPADTTGDAPAA